MLRRRPAIARLARVVIPGIPHHVTQRGNGRGRTFFEDGDYALYLDLLAAAAAERAQTEDWAWSSVRAHLSRTDDHVVRVAPGLARTGDFASFLGEEFDEALTYAPLRRAESVGRPVGSADWLEEMAARTGRVLAARKRGPVARNEKGDSQ